MTQIIKYFCDICQKECLVQDGVGTFAGFMVKINKELQSQRIGFEEHYCVACIEKILKFIDSLKKNAEHPNPAGVG